jgi:hypothetical protein
MSTTRKFSRFGLWKIRAINANVMIQQRRAMEVSVILPSDYPDSDGWKITRRFGVLTIRGPRGRGNGDIYISDSILQAGNISGTGPGSNTVQILAPRGISLYTTTTGR